MGRPENIKPKGDKPPPSMTAQKHFFLPKQLSAQASSSGPSPSKMAAAGTEQSPHLTKQDWEQSFQAFEADIINKIHALLNPIMERTEEFGDKLTHTAQTAEAAMELALTSQQDVQHFHCHEEWATERILLLEIRVRQRNLKLRGLPEKEEESADLALFVSHWLASVFSLEEGVTPTLLRAYRISPLHHPKFQGPRDILIELQDDRTHRSILQFAREKGYLLYKDNQILVLPDLPPEVLQKRQRLKQITSALQEANIKYKWSPISDILVQHHGSTLHASDPDTGHCLLQYLGLTPAPDDSKKTTKRKLDLSLTPPKWHKVQAKTSL